MNLRDFSTLQIALGVSVAAHAALLAVRFVDPEAFNRVFKDTPLEVILVNAKTNERARQGAGHRPDLAGRRRRPRQGPRHQPAAALRLHRVGDSMEDAQRQVEAMQAQQMLLLAQIKQQLAAMPLPDPRNQGTPEEARAARKSAASWSSCWPRSSGA